MKVVCMCAHVCVCVYVCVYVCVCVCVSFIHESRAFGWVQKTQDPLGAQSRLTVHSYSLQASMVVHRHACSTQAHMHTC